MSFFLQKEQRRIAVVLHRLSHEKRHIIHYFLAIKQILLLAILFICSIRNVNSIISVYFWYSHEISAS